ncbi:MAG: radical SAM family heme chaperone HemW [Lachnospiraceae bacterium]|jgi:oxygen-independent coproporphyrinogen-3 oxidase|nr:radical SAM family heme chaperone HemW [Lachnospiraceae bacterium]
MNNLPQLEIYIHIPFCVRKCLYCDFLSYPSTQKERRDYVIRLCEDIRAKKDLALEYVVSTVFIGGGTPSLLEPDQITEIFMALRDTFCFVESPEITIEANPKTFDEKKLKTWRNLGINRLSIGLQSANDNELKLLGRIHTYEDFRAAFEMARIAGFDNINVDMMIGIPAQTMQSLKKTLSEGISYNPEHISVYSLIIEEGTPFYRIYGPQSATAGCDNTKQKGTLWDELPDENAERDMMHEATRVLLENGFEHYEISNFAKCGFACRHNIGYWERIQYLGFGVGAASLIKGCRYKNSEQINSDPHEKVGETESLSLEDEMSETMFLGLRMLKGVSLDEFKYKFNTSIQEAYPEAVEKNIKNGLLEIAHARIRLTKRGLDLANVVMSDFV